MCWIALLRLTVLYSCHSFLGIKRSFEVFGVIFLHSWMSMYILCVMSVCDDKNTFYNFIIGFMCTFSALMLLSGRASNR